MPLRHSLGLVLADHDVGHREVSFAVDADGRITEVGGWAFTGPVVPAGSPMAIVLNGPADPGAVHTVLVHEDTVEARAAVRDLAVEHLHRYATGRTWTTPKTSRGLRDWAASGCPEPAGHAP